MRHPLPTIAGVTSTITPIAPRRALDALADAIATAKGDDPLAPVVVAVPTNTCGVMARRALGRARGLVGVDMVTLNRLAELIAGPALAAAGRSPVSTPVLELAVAQVLRRRPGAYRPVADHPSTITALRRLHEELRLAGPAAADALVQHSRRGREAVTVSNAVTELLAGHWYDEADLFSHATASVAAGGTGTLRRLVVHLPDELPALAWGFLHALADRIDVRIIDTADEPDTAGPRPAALVSTTDADDEVRHAVRVVIDAARRGVALERIAVVWSSQQPYARLVEHHLDNAGLRWNGRPGTTTVERLAPRLLLDLLDVDRRGLRRRGLFELLADVPARGADGSFLPTAEWERVSREAGVARDEDWQRRLGALSASTRWRDSARELADFVTDLRRQLGRPTATRRWDEWSAWCHEQLERWLGRGGIDHLPEPEYRAYETLTRALDRLAHLDAIGDPVTRHRFRLTLQAELEALPGRQGRVGDGVTVGPLAGAAGLDVDVAVVLGAAEGMLPPTPAADPLLSEADRAAAGLPTSAAHAARQRRILHALLDTSEVTITMPRGYLRATAHLLPSRWIEAWLPADDESADGDEGADGEDARPTDGPAIVRAASHHRALADTVFPATSFEHRVRGRYRHVRSGGDIATAPHVEHDATLQRGLACVTARRSPTFTAYDGDLSGVELPRLVGPVSPTRLESWVACPHAYFVRYLLGVRPVDEPDSAISITALDRGSAHHEALDRFHRAVLDGTLPQPTEDGWTAVHRDALASFFDEVCARTEQRGRTGRPAFWADERERMRAELLEWLRRDGEAARARRATVVATEHRFGDGAVALPIGDGRTLALEGSIDRVDRLADGSLVVTDHKTGTNSYASLSNEDPTLGGTLFQLPAYAAAARAAFGDADTAVRAEYSLFDKGRYERPGLVIDADVVTRVGEALAVIVDGIEHGVFPHVPERPGWRLFVKCEYCEPDHLGTADAWARWELKRHDPRFARWFAAPPADTATESDPSSDTEGAPA